MDSQSRSDSEQNVFIDNNESVEVLQQGIVGGKNNDKNMEQSSSSPKDILQEITPKMVDDSEGMLKERIAQCWNILDSLKAELKEQKPKVSELQHVTESYISNNHEIPITAPNYGDDFPSSVVSATVDCKLNCDESLMAYEKQLEKYQNTLMMAQMEKKNAIRKKMLAKAYKLKLLEVENQCNIELLRVKQSLQCLEPLQMIIDKWKTSNETDLMYDSSNLELLPRYPELKSFSSCDLNNIVGEIELDNPAEIEDIEKAVESLNS